MNLQYIFEKALSYEAYRKQVDELIGQGKTTGSTQSASYLSFTKLNIQRMNRLDKTIVIDENILKVIRKEKKKLNLLLIGDAWCGDCAQIIPVIHKMIEVDENKIDFRIISRDEFPELIEAYLTNGTKSIPKLLIMDTDNYQVLHTWGPRPKAAQEILVHWKANQNTMSKEDFEKKLHLWYAQDKGLSIAKEILDLISHN